MSLHSTAPKFGFEITSDTENTILITQKRFNEPTSSIRIQNHQIEDLRSQITDLRERILLNIK